MEDFQIELIGLVLRIKDTGVVGKILNEMVASIKGLI